jgi:hypothetical protein
LNVKLKPSELERLVLIGAPADVEVPVPLRVDETSVMIGDGIPVADRVTDCDEDLFEDVDALTGPDSSVDDP